MPAPAAGSRLPLILGGALALLGGGMYMRTSSSSSKSAASRTPPQKSNNVSETLQELAGTGGSSSRSHGDMDVAADPKNTRIFSSTPEVVSKKNSSKDGPQTLKQRYILEGGVGGNGASGRGSGDGKEAKDGK